MNAAIHPRSSHDGRAMAGHDVRVAVGVSEIAMLAGDWRALFARAAEPHQVFQSYAALSLWMKHYAEAQCEPVVVSAWQGGRLVALLPLVRQKQLGMTVLRAMGLPIAQFSDMIAEPSITPELVAMMWARMADLGAHYVEFRRVRADSALVRFAPPTELIYEPQQAPFARLAERVVSDEPGPSYSSKYRSNVRRRYRRLEDLGAVKLIGRDTKEPGQLAAKAVAMKLAWLAHHGIPSPAVEDPRFGAWFAEAAEDPEIGLQACAIELDGASIAIDLSFVCKGVGFGHVLAVDVEHEAGGIGPLMVHRSFAEAQAGGAEMFDLLAPSSEFKMSHADGVTEVSSRAYAFTPLGRIAAAVLLQHGLPRAKALATKLPPRMVGLLRGKF